jgi:ABC-type transporter Mla MlaB component
MTGQRSHTLVLSGDAGIKATAEIAQSLKDALAAYADIEIDTQTVSAADLTTVQLLLSAKLSAYATGKSLNLLAPLGAPLRAVVEAGGFLASSQPHHAFWATSPDHP